jgi:hypothetical protein
MQVEIPLTCGRVALVEAADAAWVSKFSWYAKRRGPRAWVAATNIQTISGRKTLLMHRMLLGLIDPRTQADHINGDPLDNRRANLRPCTPSENCCNRPKRSGMRSQFLGVAWDPQAAEWKAQIKKHGRRVVLGRFPSELSAAVARDAVIRELHGEFAVLNFPDEVSETLQLPNTAGT